MKFKVYSLSFLTLITLFMSVSALQAKESEGAYFFKTGFSRQAKKLLLKDLITGTANKAETCYYLGNVYYGESMNDSASYYYNEGLKADPTFVYNQVGLAKLQIKSNAAQASETFEGLLKGKNKKNVDLMIEVGQAYLSAGLFDTAFSYETRAETLKNKYAPVYVFKGDYYLALKDPGKACENYEMAIYLDKDSKDAYIKYARAYKDVNTDLAIQKLNDLKTQDPTFSLANEELAKLYYDKNRFDEAVKAFSDYVASGNDTDQDLVEYCMALLMDGNYTKCLEIANKGLARDPNNFVFNRMAMYSLVELKNFDSAATYAQKFLSTVKDPRLISYFDYMYLGRLYQAEKKYPEAAQAFESVIKLDSTKTSLYGIVSDMYENAGDHNASIIAFEKLLKSKDPAKVTEDDYVGFGKKLYNIGTSKTITKAEQTAYLMRADSIFAKVIQMDPKDYRGYFYRGHTNVAMDPDYKNIEVAGYYIKCMEIAQEKNDPRYNPVIVSSGQQAAIYYYARFSKTKSASDKETCRKICNQVLGVDANNDTCKKLLGALK